MQRRYILWNSLKESYIEAETTNSYESTAPYTHTLTHTRREKASNHRFYCTAVEKPNGNIQHAFDNTIAPTHRDSCATIHPTRCMHIPRSHCCVYDSHCVYKVAHTREGNQFVHVLVRAIVNGSHRSYAGPKPCFLTIFHVVGLGTRCYVAEWVEMLNAVEQGNGLKSTMAKYCKAAAVATATIVNEFCWFTSKLFSLRNHKWRIPFNWLGSTWD